MGLWIEVRCERRAEGDHFAEDRRCWSDDNKGPMKIANDSRESLLTTVRSIEQDARDAGWKKLREGWICPYGNGIWFGNQPMSQATPIPAGWHIERSGERIVVCGPDGTDNRNRKDPS